MLKIIPNKEVVKSHIKAHKDHYMYAFLIVGAPTAIMPFMHSLDAPFLAMHAAALIIYSEHSKKKDADKHKKRFKKREPTVNPLED